jgi:hypothetical protein
MRAKLPLLLIFVCAWLVHYGNTGSPAKKLQGQYRQANTLFYSPNPTDASDRRALELYNSIIQSFEKNNSAKDTMLFFAYVRKGVLLEVKEDAAAAKQAYLKAIAYKKQLPHGRNLLSSEQLRFSQAVL